MSNYTPDDIEMLINMLKRKLPNRSVRSKPPVTVKTPYGTFKKPFLNKTERTIKYLEQRRKHFNPTKEMLEYIINIAKHSSLEPALVEKMKEDLLTKR